MWRILLVDDHEVVRVGAREVLEQALAEPIAIQDAIGVAEARAWLERERFHLVLLDLHLPDGTGLDVLRWMHARGIDAPVLVFTGMAEDPLVREALAAGAQGIVAKTAVMDDLLRAVQEVLAGGPASSPSPQRSPAFPLSPREIDVVCHLAQGMSVQEIAQALGVRESTVHTYRRRALEKLGLTTTAELIRYAIKQGMVRGMG